MLVLLMLHTTRPSCSLGWRPLCPCTSCPAMPQDPSHSLSHADSYTHLRASHTCSSLFPFQTILSSRRPLALLPHPMTPHTPSHTDRPLIIPRTRLLSASPAPTHTHESTHTHSVPHTHEGLSHTFSLSLSHLLFNKPCTYTYTYTTTHLKAQGIRSQRQSRSLILPQNTATHTPPVTRMPCTHTRTHTLPRYKHALHT